MMSFITVVTGVVAAVVEYLLSKAGTLIVAAIKAYEKKQAIAEQAQADEKQVESAVTSDDKTAAAAQLGRDTFSN